MWSSDWAHGCSVCERAPWRGQECREKLLFVCWEVCPSTRCLSDSFENPPFILMTSQLFNISSSSALTTYNSLLILVMMRRGLWMSSMVHFKPSRKYTTALGETDRFEAHRWSRGSFGPSAKSVTAQISSPSNQAWEAVFPHFGRLYDDLTDALLTVYEWHPC